MTRSCLAIHYLAFEDLGYFAPVLRDRGLALRGAAAGIDGLPDPLADDLVVIMGGPIGIWQQDRYPWIADQLAWLRQRLQARRPTLGVCLGGQAIAAALGAVVAPAPVKELGFAPLSLTPAGLASPLAPFADDPVTMHWHGDGFELPEGATLLARSALCERQAFALGPEILALQFHPEIGGPGMERWLISAAAELTDHGLDIAQLRAQALALGPALQAKAARMLTAWLEPLGL